MDELLKEILVRLSGGAAVVGIVFFVFWKADDLISKSGKDLLDKLIKETISDPERSELRRVLIAFLKQYFSLRLPAHAFVANVALLTASSMAILICIYVTNTANFASQLASDLYARELFLIQFLFNGFIVTYCVNHIAFSLYSPLIERFDLGTASWSGLIVVADVVLKIILFIAATAASYAIFAWYGAFAGSMPAAMHAILPTIANGLRFENLTGVYLYSVAISSLPIFLTCLINILGANPTIATLVRRLFFWLPFEGRPMRSLAVVLGTFAITFYQISRSALALV